jgi:hypothetical protein
MTDRVGPCPDAQQLVDLAVGKLAGRDRAAVLAHLLGCRTCREQVDVLIGTIEELLLAAPQAEPPVGFESQVVERLGAVPATGRRRVRAGTVLVAAAACVALVVSAAFIGGRLASKRQGDLGDAAVMATPSGDVVGSAWLYGGDPSWVLVSVPGWETWDDGSAAPRGYELQVVLEDGTAVGLGAVTFGNEGKSWGTTTTLDTDRIRSVAIVDQSGVPWCSALFEA